MVIRRSDFPKLILHLILLDWFVMSRTVSPRSITCIFGGAIFWYNYSMKKILRMIVFSAVAIYFTSLWNKGFIIETDWMIYLKASLVIAAIYYLVVPVSKLILLPLNIITLGLVSVIFYSLVLYFFLNKFSLIQIKPWNFIGL